ncbi:uncharacterized protein EV422DRAFT_307004 [Fimicolochytrium jonesii]|uniref:uncharacterized protein n=1 Tax=Fimicolochytrium jonesii TaxID=1396493 RepID=UPI0022FF2474|nr:uncharacterized protein EV422DRAFT_307004 [Fimicolochytrium jonesii]KAI8824110.1 hypothetical protein EV422DRAFT_307004 [Fimicolochytrium jonesii]
MSEQGYSGDDIAESNQGGSDSGADDQSNVGPEDAVGGEHVAQPTTTGRATYTPGATTLATNALPIGAGEGGEENLDIDRIVKLEAVKNRLSHLSEALQDFLQLPEFGHWPNALTQFNILVARFESLLGDLRSRKEWLRTTIVAPSSIIPEVPEWTPNVLLRTTVEPQITEEEQKILDESSRISVNYLDQEAVEAAKQTLLDRMERHDILIREFLEDTRSREYDKQLKTRLPVSQDQVNPFDEAGQENKRDLERVLMWMASGPESWEEKRRMTYGGSAP